MIVDEEDELAQWLELVRERLRELRETSLEAAPSVEEGRELLPELRGVAPHGTDEIGEQDERILVASLQGEPGGATTGRAQEIRVLGEDGGLAVARGRVHERQSVALRALQTIE